MMFKKHFGVNTKRKKNPRILFILLQEYFNDEKLSLLFKKNRNTFEMCDKERSTVKYSKGNFLIKGFPSFNFLFFYKIRF